MQIEQIDKNMVVDANITQEDIVWYDILQPPFSIHGLIFDSDDNGFVRMPRSVARTVSGSVNDLNRRTSGGRVRFRTDSDYIAIRAELRGHRLMPHMPLLSQSGFDLYRNNVFHRAFMPPFDLHNDYCCERPVAAGEADYMINFPLYRGVRHLYVALRKGAKLLPATPYTHEKPVVFYGSSITAGACSGRPGMSYVNTLCRRLDTEYVNLGFSGSCLAEPPMAEYLAGLDMSVFVYDFDHNAKSAEQLADRHKPLFDRVRQSHPDLPIILASAPDLPFDPPKFAARREVVLDTYRKAVVAGDQNVYFVDGATVLGDDWDNCLTDGVHPNDLGQYRMADSFEAVFRQFWK